MLTYVLILFGTFRWWASRWVNDRYWHVTLHRSQFYTVEEPRHWPGRAAVPSSWGDLSPPLVAHFCCAHPWAGSPVPNNTDHRPSIKTGRARRKRQGRGNGLPNPDISSVASLLHARGFHILFSCCLAHFPKTAMATKQLLISGYCSHKTRANCGKHSSFCGAHAQKSFSFDLCLNCGEVL